MSIKKLRDKLIHVRKRGLERYRYYDMHELVRDFGISTPPELRNWQSCLGWCAKGVDSLADRLEYAGVQDDILETAGIFSANNEDVLMRSAFLGALITSCDFVYISRGETGPRLQIIDGTSATGVLDPTTQMLVEGYAVLEWEDREYIEHGRRHFYDYPKREAYFTADWTAYYEDGDLVETVANPAPYPLLVPIIYRPDAVRPFGHSRLSRAAMSLVGSALRTVKRSEISAEFYSFPQKWATGVDTSAEHYDSWTAAMSAMMRFELNEDGTDHVRLGQFAQQSMTPHVDQLRMFASLFAGEMGLTLDDLGFAAANPSSAEAIRSAHENLRLQARAAQKSFGTGLINAGYLAACVRDGMAYRREALSGSRILWRPPFPADVSMLGAVGDGIAKLAEYYPDYFSEAKLYELTGV